MSEPTRHDWRNGALLASVALAALLALAAAWISALARVPQQRATVERLLRAQTGLEVRYDRLVVRLGFYGPEAEFSNVEMLRPGAAAPLLRAPRMIARFESWRLLRGGQLRPGRVLVTGAEVDLRQLVDLRRGAAAAGDANATRAVAFAGPVQGEPADAFATLEAQLPALLADIPEGSLDFEAVTLVWTDPARLAEPLLLRAPRLYASRRVDGAQFSATLLLPARFGRTLFVAATLRHGAHPGAPFEGRLRLAGRGLALASWRQLGLLPAALAGGGGDVTAVLQLRDGRVQLAEGGVRLARLALAPPPPVVARRFGATSAEFDFARLAGGGWRWRLRDVVAQSSGAAGGPFAARGDLELRRDPGRDGVSLQARRLPLEFTALLGGVDGGLALPVLRVEAGEVVELEGRWFGDGRLNSLRGRVDGVTIASADRLWRATGFSVQLAGEGTRWRFALDGPTTELQAPGLEALSQAHGAALRGTADLALASQGWSLALRDASLQWPDGLALRVSGSAGRDHLARDSSRFELALAEPLPRAAMTLPQAALGHWLPASFWTAFVAGRVETARLEIVDGTPRAAELALREVAFAGDATRPASSGLALDLGWDGRRIEGLLSGGQVGPLQLESGRLLWRDPGGAPGRTGLEVEARLLGSVQDALRLAGTGALPGDVLAAGLRGRARIDARLRRATAAGSREAPTTLDYALEIEDGRWRPVAAAAPLTGLRGRLRADAGGLRDGRLDGRWLGGPVQLRLVAEPRGELRITAGGTVARSALAREWSWLEFSGHDREADLDWTAELRPEAEIADTVRPRRRASRSPAADDAASVPSTPWRMRVALADAARAEFHWLPQTAGGDGWRLDRGIVHFGDASLPRAIPGALVVGGAVEHLELAGLAAALARVVGGEGWQRPLVGELRIDDVALGGASIGASRLRLAGSRDSTSIDLEGPTLAGELRQAHQPRAPLQARFARLRLAGDAPLAALADAFLPVAGVIELQVADLQRGSRSLGELRARFESDGTAITTRDLLLRRGAQRLGASGRCERATLSCSAEFTLADAELGPLQSDLGEVPSVQGREVSATGRIGWSMQPGSRFAATLQGEVELHARLEGRVPAMLGPGAASVAGDDLDPAQVAAPTWPLLVPLVATVAAQRAWQSEGGASASGGADVDAIRPGANQPGVAAPATIAERLEDSLALERLELRLAFRDGVATIERYDAIGRAARLDVVGRFDFRDDQLEQQAEWHWIAPGVAGAVDRLDPRSPLATGLRTLRELFARREAGRGAAASAPPGVTSPGDAHPERFLLQGPLRQPRIARTPLLDSSQ